MNADSAAAPLLQPHLVADVSGELDQAVLHGDVSASCHVFASAADLADLSDDGVVQAEQQTPPPAPVSSIST